MSSQLTGNVASSNVVKAFEAVAKLRSDRDWPEDFEDENGKYYCTCCNCNKLFIGYKRRVICKICSQLASQ